MRPQRDPVPRAKDAWGWLGGVLLLGILGGGVVAAAVSLWESVDVRQLVPGLVVPTATPPVPEAAATPAHAPGTFSAVLYRSRASAAYFPDSTFHSRSIDAWRAVVEAVGGVVREVSDPGGLTSLTREDLLVVPEAPCLSRDELAAVYGHLAGGGGVVANWAFGARDGDCDWRGWDALGRLAAAQDVREVPARDALFLTAPAGHPLSVGLDPGTRVELRADPVPALRVAGLRVFWSDWALNPAPDESGGAADVAATVHRAASGGRVAWFGARLNQAATPLDEARLHRLVQNGVLIAAGRPIAAPAPWPRGARAAMMVAIDVESGAANAVPLASRLRQDSIPTTFFAVTGLVGDDPGLAAALSAAGEVGSQTSDHTPLTPRTAQDQRVRLRRSWSEVGDWTGVAPAGLHPPEESFDTHTLEGWARTGGAYLLAVTEGRSASPELHRTDAGPMVVLPRLMKDDYNVVVQESAIRSQRLTEEYLEGAGKLRALGGLAVVSGRTQILNSSARRNALLDVVDTVRAQGDWWMAEGREVARWWRARSRVSLRFVAGDGQALPFRDIRPSGLPHLLVSLPEDAEPVEGLWVDVVLPRAETDVVPWVDGVPSAFASTALGMRIPVGPLAPGVVREIRFISVEPTGAPVPP